MKVCMLSSVHTADDIRIVEKEARSLSGSGHEVTVVARPPVSGDAGNISFRTIALPSVARWKRPWTVGRAAIAMARAAEPDVVHFHDPELIPFALGLKRRGCRVIYDVHEDVPADIYSKSWIPSLVKPAVAHGMELVERNTARRFDAIVAATPAIANRFRRYGAAVSLVRNSVRLEEFIEPTFDVPRCRQAVYVGHISFNRGLIEMVEACAIANLPLVMAGSIGASEAAWLKKSAAQVIYRGKLDRSAIAKLLNESLIGLCLFRSDPNHLHAIPTKVFEYMAAGLPVVTSDLPTCREIVETAACGFAVPLKEREELSGKLTMLANNPRRALELGLAGRAAVVRNYSWEQDASELRALYERMSLPRADA